MLGGFQPSFWSRTKAACLQPWSLDRNWDRTEGERLLRARDFEAAEIHLTRLNAWLLSGARAASGWRWVMTLAYVEECSGRYAEASAELQQAVKVWETLQPERLRELLRCLEHRADLLDLLRRKGDADRLRERIALLTPKLEGQLAAVGQA